MTRPGERLRGTLPVTNLARRQPDGVNGPVQRGPLTTDDGTQVYVAMDGVGTTRQADSACVFFASSTCRTGDSRYAWLNRLTGVVERAVDAVAAGGVARIRGYSYDATI